MADDCEHEWFGPLCFEGVSATFCPKCMGNAIGYDGFIRDFLSERAARPAYHWLGCDADLSKVEITRRAAHG